MILHRNLSFLIVSKFVRYKENISAYKIRFLSKIVVTVIFSRISTECMHVFISQKWNMSTNFNKARHKQLHKNLFRNSQVVACEGMDTHDEAKKFTCITLL